MISCACFYFSCLTCILFFLTEAACFLQGFSFVSLLHAVWTALSLLQVASATCAFFFFLKLYLSSSNVHRTKQKQNFKCLPDSFINLKYSYKNHHDIEVKPNSVVQACGNRMQVSSRWTSQTLTQRRVFFLKCVVNEWRQKPQSWLKIWSFIASSLRCL